MLDLVDSESEQWFVVEHAVGQRIKNRLILSKSRTLSHNRVSRTLDPDPFSDCLRRTTCLGLERSSGQA
jgi:hypothetical protein